MPYPLGLFTLGFVLGLIQLSHLPHLPAWLPVTTSALGVIQLALLLLSVCCVVVCNQFISRRQSIPKRRLALVLAAFAGYTLGFSIAGLVAVNTQLHQVPLSCHGVEVNGKFEVESLDFKPDGQLLATLITEQPEISECVRQGTRLQVWVDQSNDWQPSQVIQAPIKLKPLWAKLQHHGFDAEKWWFIQNIHGLGTLRHWKPVERESQIGLEKLRYAIGAWINENLAHHTQKGLILALVIDDQGLITPDSKLFYSEAGLAHLVAISGFHITLFAVVFGHLISKLWRLSTKLCRWQPAQKIAPVAGIALAVIYSFIAGWGIPAQRTLLMMSLWYLSSLSGGLTSAWDVWLLALLVILHLSPMSVFDAGLLLSFGAVGLLIWSSQGSIWLNNSPWHPMRLALWAQYVCTVGLIPITANLFQFQSWISPLTNAFAISWMSFVTTPLALLGTLTHQSWAIQLAADSLDVQEAILSPMVDILGTGMAIPYWPWWVVCISIITALWLTSPATQYRWVAGLSLMLCLLYRPILLPENQVKLTFHDVGQGTAITIQTRSHTLVYDTGAAFTEASNVARRILEPYLRHEGIDKVEQLWLSHDDRDHTGGAGYLLKRFSVNSLVTSFEVNQNLLAASQSIKHSLCNTQNTWQWNGVWFKPMSTEPTKLDSDNNKSCVLKIETAYSSVLVTGDIEAAAEIRLVNLYGDALKADWLVAPHHGSKTSSTVSFLEKVRPKYVVIQAGWKNAYGHPHPDVIARYQSLSATVFNTAQIGALELWLGVNQTEEFAQPAREKRAGFWRLHD